MMNNPSKSSGQFPEQSTGTPADRSSENDFAKSLRGFGPLGILSMVIILLIGNNIMVGNMIVIPAGTILVLIWVKISHTPWSDIGYVKPKSWVRTIVIGAMLGCAFKFSMKALVMPLLGADPVNHAYHFLEGNRAMLTAAIWAMINAGFAEETAVRGYFFERLKKLFGTSFIAKVAIVLITSVIFGLEHYHDQGLAGAEQAGIVGLVYGTIFIITGRIVPLMAAHAAFDLTALWMIYNGLETSIAHLIFK